MKTSLKYILMLLSVFLLQLSCRKEEFISIPGPDEQPLANSMVAELLERTALNDGSLDNIIDQSNCFTVQLPVMVYVNGMELRVETEEDYDRIEAIFDASTEDNDMLQIEFPITILLKDFREVAIADQGELDTFSAGCNGENEADDDIECLDIEYPITASIFNQTTEVFDHISIVSDAQLYYFIDALGGDDVVTIAFPINVVFADGTTIAVGSLSQLEDVIDAAKDSCDEDDDYDYDDDDCNNCTTNLVTEVLTSCTDWMVDKLERNDQDLEDNYAGYRLRFATDGTLTAINSSSTFSGTWVPSGLGNNVTVTLTIPNLTDFNATWNLHEIEQQSAEHKVELRLGEDRLRLESNCLDNEGNTNENPSTLATALTDGLWTVASYIEDAEDRTANYSGYILDFDNTGTVIADNGKSINGTWAAQNMDMELVLNFEDSIPFEDLNDSWEVILISATEVEVRDASGGNETIDTLILTKQ